MKDFDAFERKYERTPVRLVDYEPATGVLYLKGDDTLLHASSTQDIHPGPSDENGWYSLKLQAADGRRMLLHHALTLSTATHRWEDYDVHSAEIFPNLVVEDIRGLTENGQVSRVHFRLRGLKYFFYYRHTEPLVGFKATDEQVEALRNMRAEAPADEDLFAPRFLYVWHEYPKFLSLRVGDRTYEVWSGGREGFGSFHGIDVEVYPVASISFDEPVDLEAALDRVWEWRTFFAEMAMLPLQAEGISVQASLEERTPTADLYMPGARRYPDFKDHYYKVHPAYLPLNRWEDRDALAAGMQKWLESAGSRGKFRSKLYRVIESMSIRTDSRDLVDLASAVESLEELSSAASMPGDTFDKMIEAAHKAAAEDEVEIDAQRIRGLLGNLQRPSLASRYLRMGEHVTPALNPSDADLLSRSATRIRNASAHGGALDDQVQPRVSPTLQALAALCCRFDLETCGIRAEAGSDSGEMTKRRFLDAIDQLKRIEAEAPAPK